MLWSVLLWAFQQYERRDEAARYRAEVAWSVIAKYGQKESAVAGNGVELGHCRLYIIDNHPWSGAAPWTVYIDKDGVRLTFRCYSPDALQAFVSQVARRERGERGVPKGERWAIGTDYLTRFHMGEAIDVEIGKVVEWDFGCWYSSESYIRWLIKDP